MERRRRGNTWWKRCGDANRWRDDAWRDRSGRIRCGRLVAVGHKVRCSLLFLLAIAVRCGLSGWGRWWWRYPIVASRGRERSRSRWRVAVLISSPLCLGLVVCFCSQCSVALRFRRMAVRLRCSALGFRQLRALAGSMLLLILGEAGSRLESAGFWSRRRCREECWRWRIVGVVGGPDWRRSRSVGVRGSRGGGHRGCRGLVEGWCSCRHPPIERWRRSRRERWRRWWRPRRRRRVVDRWRSVVAVC